MSAAHAEPGFDNRWYVLALCPAFGVTGTATGALLMAVAVISGCIIVALVLPALRQQPEPFGWAVRVLILSAVIGSLALLFDAWVHEPYALLGIFLPLLIVNPVILQMKREPQAFRQTLAAGVRIGLTMGATLLVLGAARELVGRGSLAHDSGFALQLFPAELGFLLATLPPGAFIAFGLLLAARNWLTQRRHESTADR